MPEFTTTDGVRLHYLDSADLAVPARRSGMTVVLVAGYLAPAGSWLFQQRALEPAGHRVLALDRRSHGTSDDPTFGLRMARHGADLQEFLVELDLPDVILVGGSMGASTIWAMVDLFGTDRVAGVLTIDQTPKMVNAPDWAHGFYGLTPENVGTFFAAGIPATGRGRWDGPPPEQAVELAAHLLPGATPDKLDRLYPLLLDHAVQDWRDVIARLDIPALYVAGRNSGFWPCEHAAASAADNPRARSIIIENAGHATNLDQVDEFNTVMLDFVQRVHG